jgi:AcrR family transcriptional regulator
VNPGSVSRTRVQTKAPARPSLRERKREVAADAILDAAEIELTTVGLHVRMDAIARRAGVAVGTLYNHFADRDALLDALFAARRRQMFARVTDALEQSAHERFEPRLRAALRALLIAPPERSAFRRLLFNDARPVTRREQRKKIEELARLFAPVLDAGRAEGALAPDPSGLQPMFLISLVGMTLQLSVDAPQRLALDAAAELVLRQFLDGARERGA